MSDKPRDPESMELGLIHEELDMLTTAKTLALLGRQDAYDHAPYVSDEKSLQNRQATLYAELDRREKTFAKAGHRHLKPREVMRY